MELTDEDQKWISKNIKEDPDLLKKNLGIDFSEAMDNLEEKETEPLPWETPEYLESLKGGEEKYMPNEVDYSSYEVPTTGGQYLKLDAGENRIRICSKAFEVKFHSQQDTGKYKSVKCTGEGCPLCAKGEALKYKYAFLVINRKDKSVCIWEAPVTAFRLVLVLAKNADYGNPEEYDITVTRTGEGKNTTYAVLPSPKKTKLTDEESEMLGKANISMKELYS